MIRKLKGRVRAIQTGLAAEWRTGQDKAGQDRASRGLGRRRRAVVRALMAEIDREAHVDGATPPDLAAVSAQWAMSRDQGFLSSSLGRNSNG